LQPKVNRVNTRIKIIKSKNFLAIDRTPYQFDSSLGFKKRSVPFYIWRFKNAKTISLGYYPYFQP